MAISSISHGKVLLLTAAPVEPGDRLEACFLHPAGGIDITLQLEVHWRRDADDGLWYVGCHCDDPVSFEMLGELFLNHVVRDTSPARERGTRYERFH